MRLLFLGGTAGKCLASRLPGGRPAWWCEDGVYDPLGNRLPPGIAGRPIPDWRAVHPALVAALCSHLSRLGDVRATPSGCAVRLDPGSWAEVYVFADDGLYLDAGYLVDLADPEELEEALRRGPAEAYRLALRRIGERSGELERLLPLSGPAYVADAPWGYAVVSLTAAVGLSCEMDAELVVTRGARCMYNAEARTLRADCSAAGEPEPSLVAAEAEKAMRPLAECMRRARDPGEALRCTIEQQI